MPTTSNFGWTTPADTDLVKDGAAAIRTLGNGIDTSLVDLKGGTTGQVLSKASNTDLDFTWVAVDPLTILDAKGDLISATAADTPARLAVGTNGQILYADSTASTGLKWDNAPSSGSLTLLSTTTLSGATTTISSISSAYQHLYIVAYGMTNDTANGKFRIAPNGTTNISTGLRMDNAAGLLTSFTDDYMQINNGGTNTDRTDANGFVELTIWNYAQTTYRKSFIATGITKIFGALYNVWATGSINTASAISSLVFSNSGGNWSAGTVLVYGVK